MLLLNLDATLFDPNDKSVTLQTLIVKLSSPTGLGLKITRRALWTARRRNLQARQLLLG